MIEGVLYTWFFYIWYHFEGTHRGDREESGGGLNGTDLWYLQGEGVDIILDPLWYMYSIPEFPTGCLILAISFQI